MISRGNCNDLFPIIRSAVIVDILLELGVVKEDRFDVGSRVQIGRAAGSFQRAKAGPVVAHARSVLAIGIRQAPLAGTGPSLAHGKGRNLRADLRGESGAVRRAVGSGKLVPPLAIRHVHFLVLADLGKGVLEIVRSPPGRKGVAPDFGSLAGNVVVVVRVVDEVLGIKAALLVPVIVGRLAQRLAALACGGAAEFRVVYEEDRAVCRHVDRALSLAQGLFERKGGVEGVDEGLAAHYLFAADALEGFQVQGLAVLVRILAASEHVLRGLHAIGVLVATGRNLPGILDCVDGIRKFPDLNVVQISVGVRGAYEQEPQAGASGHSGRYVHGSYGIPVPLLADIYQKGPVTINVHPDFHVIIWCGRRRVLGPEGYGVKLVFLKRVVCQAAIALGLFHQAGIVARNRDLAPLRQRARAPVVPNGAGNAGREGRELGRMAAHHRGFRAQAGVRPAVDSALKPLAHPGKHALAGVSGVLTAAGELALAGDALIGNDVENAGLIAGNAVIT